MLSGRADLASEADSLDAHSMERSLCRYPLDDEGPVTAASLLVESKTEQQPALAWCAFGPPGLSVYFPIFLGGELPAVFEESQDGACQLWQRFMHLAIRRGDAERRAALREGLANLQVRFDHLTRETLAEVATLTEQRNGDAVQRLLWSFMQANVERFEEFWTEVAELPATAAIF